MGCIVGCWEDAVAVRRWSRWTGGCGAALVVIGVVIGLLIRASLYAAINEAVVIDSPTHVSYTSWLRTNDGPDPFYRQEMYFFNITNIQDVVATGAQPIVRQVGPYVYEKVQEKIDVAFSHGGERVSYKDMTSYQLQPDSPNKDSDIIYQINPTYLAAIFAPISPTQRLTELGLTSSLTATFLNTTLTSLSGSLAPKLYYGSFPATVGRWYSDVVQSVYAGNTASFLNDFSQTETAVPLTSSTQPLASITLPTGYSWQLPLLSCTLPPSASLCTSDKLPVTTAAALFTSMVPYSFLNTATSQYWIKAAQGDQKAAALLKKNFGLGEPQYAKLINWVGVFLNVYHSPYLTFIRQSTWGVQGYTGQADIPYLQFGSLAALDGASLHSIGEAPFYIEYAAWAKFVKNSPAVFNVAQTRLLLDGNSTCSPGGFLKTQNVIKFFSDLATNKIPQIMECYGFTSPTQVLSWKEYLDFVVGQTLLPLCNNFNCLWKRTTVRNYLFGVEPDPLLLLLKFSVDRFGIFSNITRKEDRQVKGENIVYTGKNNLGKIRQYIKYYGEEQLLTVNRANLWAEPVKVQGSDVNQFEPRSDPNKITVFSTTLTRPISLQYEKNIRVRGIAVRKYVLQADEIASMSKNPENAKYYYYIDGVHNYTTYEFLKGVNGLPIFVTLPHMLYADPSFRNQVQLQLADGSIMSGMQPVEADHAPFLARDELTGVTMKAALGSQFVVKLDQAASAVFNSPLLFAGKVNQNALPVMWSKESSQLTKDQADAYEATVESAQRAWRAVLIVLPSVGGFLLLVSALLWYHSRHISSPVTREMEFEYDPASGSRMMAMTPPVTH
eukprot:TRINITY_DN2340_c0_g1_i1.p1 TRINITY_DN2340_c0_g1~~TRINITY_DN2340_c0_g1_i1.p1  ORF type:complete len:836 (+),score=133.76 TRINITY_DN2340_c0_g1_i1:156-2663(+)